MLELMIFSCGFPISIIKQPSSTIFHPLDERRHGPLNVNPVIKSPLRYRNVSLSEYLITKEDWNHQLVRSSDYAMAHSLQRPQCFLRPVDEKYVTVIDDLIGYPQQVETYTEPPRRCRVASFEPRTFYSFEPIASLFETFVSDSSSVMAASHVASVCSLIIAALIASLTLVKFHL